MSDAIISGLQLPINHGAFLMPLTTMLCPHCGARNGIVVDEWEYCITKDESYDCRKCHENMQSPTVEKLTEAGLAFLQAIKESEGPIKFEDLVKAAGFSDSALKRAMPTLKAVGVKSTAAGYVYEKRT